MSGARGRSRLSRIVRDYGMAGVLALLCIYYSWATNAEQHPRGSTAARLLARQMARERPPPATVLIVGSTTDEDRSFAATLAPLLQKRGYQITGSILGDPRAARQALQRQTTPLSVIATTPECASWTVFTDLQIKFPALGEPRVMAADSYRWPTFLKRENLLNVANQIAVVAILAVGLTLVIIAGGIDLSVGSLIALAAVVTTLLIRNHGGVEASTSVMLASGAAGIAVCAAIGFGSGVVITRFRIPPFIATLAVMQIASGLAYILAEGGSIYEVPDSFATLGRGAGWFALPHAVGLMLALYIIAHIFMTQTATGRQIYAIGGNLEAAWLSGVRVDAVLIFVYMLSGALAGLGGVVMASQLKSGAPTYGGSYELYVIAAVVVGGASLSGGQGQVFGTLIGALIIGVIQNGMNLTGVESYTQKVVLGLVILGAVLLDMLKRQGWRALLAGRRTHPGE